MDSARAGIQDRLFYLSASIFRRHLSELVIQHYDHRQDLVAKAKDILAEENMAALAERLSGLWDKWARRDADGKLIPIRAKGMFRDLGITRVDGSKVSFACDVMYFSKSHAVHSTIASLDTIFKEPVCTLSPTPNETLALIALNSANVFLVQAFADFEQYMGAECFQPELDQVWADMTEEIKRVAEGLESIGSPD